MLPVVQTVLRNPPVQRAIDVVTRLGLQNGLKLCLDTGDFESFTSGQSWLDRSGGGYDFFLGTTSGVQATDPTFNGNPGDLKPSAYWSSDGGDHFRYDTTNESWMNNLHKAAAKFTLVFWQNCVWSQAGRGLMGTRGSNVPITGMEIIRGASGRQIRFDVQNAGVSVLDVTTTALTMTDSVWQMISLSVDEASAIGYFGLNNIFEDFVSTYVSPAAGAASQPMEILARGNANQIMLSGATIAVAMAWETVILGRGELAELYNAMKGRFG